MKKVDDKMKNKINQIVALAEKNGTATFSSEEIIYSIINAAFAGIDVELEPERENHWFIQNELTFELVKELTALSQISDWVADNNVTILDVQA